MELKTHLQFVHATNNINNEIEFCIGVKLAHKTDDIVIAKSEMEKKGCSMVKSKHLLFIHIFYNKSSFEATEGAIVKAKSTISEYNRLKSVFSFQRASKET